MSDATQPSRLVRRFFAWGLAIVAAVVTGSTLWQSGAFEQPAHVALITASADPYWEDAIIGAKTAADRLEVKLTVHSPKSKDEQSQMIEQLLAAAIDGIAISPIDPEGQAPVLQEAARGTNLVTFDSDSPVPGRLCFVGTDNYAAGRRTGEMVKQALPSGGKIAITIGSLEKVNGQRRWQGLIDELMDRSYSPERETEDVGGERIGPQFTIVATLQDENDAAQAEANVTAALKSHSDLNGVIGLYAYHAPAILTAVRMTDKVGEIQIIGFDYHPDTLSAIETGEIFATVAQDPYNYGYHAVRVLAEAALDHDEALPMNEMLHFPCLIVKQPDVAEFRNSLTQRQARSQRRG